MSSPFTKADTVYFSALIVAIAIFNFISRTLIDYALGLFIVSLFTLFFIRTEKPRPWHSLFPSTGLEFAFSLLLGAITISHLANGNLGHYEVSEIGEYRWILAIYPLVYILGYISKRERLLKIYLWIMAFLSIFCTVKFLLLRMEPNPPYRLIGFFHSPTDFGHSIMFPFLVSLTLFLAPQENMTRKKKMAYLICTFAIGSAFLFTYTRSTHLAAACAALLLAFLINKRIFAAMIATLVVAFGVIYFTNIFGLWDRINIGPSLSQTTDFATRERLALMKANKAIFLDHPFFGVGYHHNQLLVEEYYKKLNTPPGFVFAHAHNQVLNFLAGTGLLGGISYCIFLITLGIYSLKNFFFFAKKSFEKNIALMTVGVVFAFAVAGMTDSNFELIPVQYNLLLIMAIIAYQRRLRLAGQKG